MEKNLIKKHNFEVAKRNIENFSNKLPSNPSFDQVEVKGFLFGLGDHMVTGAEMNNFVGEVQQKLISVNDSLHSIIEEFREVYCAFDYLDKEYVAGIVGSVESAEEASNQALKAQEDLKETVSNLGKTVKGLVDLKTRVENLEEKDIDTLLNDMERIKEDLSVLRMHIENSVREFHSIFHEHRDSIKKIAEANASAQSMYEKKIKIAYGMGGIALALSIIDFILQFIGVL